MHKYADIQGGSKEKAGTRPASSVHCNCPPLAGTNND